MSNITKLDQDVKVVIRSKEDDKLFAKRIMTKRDSISFTAMWDFHHLESDYYVSVEPV